MSCLFCKIINKEVSSYKVYKDNNVFAFLDIAPISHGHTLVVPKKHYANLEEIPEDELCKLVVAVKKVGGILKKNLDVQGYNVGINNDPVAGQVISHIHFHIIPRKQGDGLRHWPEGKYKKGEAEKILKRITHNIN